MRTNTPKQKKGGVLIRYHDPTRVINTGDRIELRFVDVIADGAVKESLDYARARLFPNEPWHMVLQRMIEKGVEFYAGLAMMDEVHDREAGE